MNNFSPVRFLKKLIKRIPAIGPAIVYARGQSRIAKVEQLKTQPAFRGSTAYWEEHYRGGGDAGEGSKGRLAEFKAEIVNEFVAREGINSVIEFGCGDGSQLSLARYPNYLGVDVSPTAIGRCRMLFGDDPHRTFLTADQYQGQTADLALSLDVIPHLIEDEVFDAYLKQLFNAGRKFVIIYSSNFDTESAPTSQHIRNRQFTLWVAAHRPDWQLTRHIPNRYPFNGDATETSTSDFFVFSKSA